MKLFILIASVLILNSAKTYACSPPYYAFIPQKMEISSMLEDKDVQAALEKAVNDNRGTYITSISTTDVGYQIALSNECSIVAEPQWKKDKEPGMCPQLEGFKVTTSCKK
ncbi:MAG: hypothetical protein V4596_00280 [Bdellovibrionota bacterium]